MTEYYNELIYILRILISGICGIIIGFERKNRLKEAGIRTHCLVACGAALMMILSKYAFYDLNVNEFGVRGVDPARIAAQVVSGIGFLGAGMIFVHRNTITGLTTAAGVWTTAGIGMAVGAGMYMLGFAVTLVVVIVQVVFHLNSASTAFCKIKLIKIFNVDLDDYQSQLEAKFLEKGITINKVSMTKSDGFKNYQIEVGIPINLNEEKVISLIDYDSEIVEEE